MAGPQQINTATKSQPVGKRAALTVLVWALASLWTAPLPAAGLPETIARIKPSIVAVGTYQGIRRPAEKFLGTGFVVAGGNLVVTNLHVIPPLLDSEVPETLAVFVRDGKSISMRKASKIAVDADHDLALLQFEGKPLPPMQLGVPDGVREGEIYAFTGFPIGNVLGFFPVTHQAMIASKTPIVLPPVSTQQLDAKMLKRLLAPFDILQLDGTAYPGNSGSPLYDPESGAVVGVINMVFVKDTKEKVLQEPSGISYAIPVKYVIGLMAGIKQ